MNSSPETGSNATKVTHATHATHARKAVSQAPKPAAREFTKAAGALSPSTRHRRESGRYRVAKAAFALEKKPGDEGDVRGFAPRARTSSVAVRMLAVSAGMAIISRRALGWGGAGRVVPLRCVGV